jgi:hypothetical protein
MALREVDFLRYLTDYIDQQLAAKTQQSDVEEVGAEEVTDAEDEGNDASNPMDRDDVFVPPLQAKIEMMKMITGVPPKDETLKQSQEQGGPAPGGAPAPAAELKKKLTLSDMFDDGPADE